MNISTNFFKRFNKFHILVIFSFCIYLAFANYLFLDVIHAKDELHLEKALPPKASGKINYWIQSIQIKKSSWKNTVYIGGGVFKENKAADSENSIVKIYLKNMLDPDDIFLVHTGTFIFKNKVTYETINYQNFKTLFSVHKLKNNGLYRLGILVENSSGQSFTWTDNYLEKNGDEIVVKSLDSFISSQTNFDFSILKPGKVQGGIDKIETSISKEAEVLKIYGWAVVPDKKSEQQKGYVVLKDTNGNRTVYDTFKYSSPMVAEIFKSDLYSESGIYAAVPVSDFTDGEYEVSIYTENDRLYEMQVKKVVVITDGGKKVNIRDINTFISNQTKFDFNTVKPGKVQGGIDKIESSTAKETSVLKIYGWAVVPDKKSEQQKGYVVLKDAKGNRTIYDTFAYSSPMVAQIFKSDLYSESGIYAAVPVSNLTDGDYEVYIYTENDGLYEMQVNKTVEVADKGKKISIKDK